MTPPRPPAHTLELFDRATRELVRLAALVTMGRENAMRTALGDAMDVIPPEWIEVMFRQPDLFAGFPRALNAMREWRRLSTRPSTPEGSRDVAEWRAAGEQTCAAVYGPTYERLRRNIRQLHPAFDEWMIVEGYGKVLSRPGLDLPRRELCIVAACAAAEQGRQLHSHLHGAINVGVAPATIDALMDALQGVVTEAANRSARLLWARVRGK